MVLGSLASTTLNEHGFNKDAIERQLAHKEPNKIRAAYNHAEYMTERKEMMEWWGEFIKSNEIE
jgi:integrase